MSGERYLIDTSALFRVFADGDLYERWSRTMAAGLIAICPIVELEFAFSARSPADRAENDRLLADTFAWVPMADRAWERARAVQLRLTEQGSHRSAGPVDLLIAATAEEHRLAVLCDDRDYLTVARVTGQPVVRLADPPRSD